jgi:hypothetical protein
MNIPDKPRFASEAARVLGPGGRLSCVEVSRGPTGSPTFPLPWAREPADSFLVTPAELREALEGAGLRVIEQSSELSLPSSPVAAVMAGNAVAMGDDFHVRAANRAKSTREGALVELFILAEKP